MKDAAQYNIEMKVKLPRYRVKWVTCKRTGFRYKIVQTLGRGE